MVVGSIPTPLTNQINGLGMTLRGQMQNVRLFRNCPRPTFAVALLLQLIVVIDGDTVERGGVRWRIAGIDAPEIHGARCAAERQAGIIAAARLIALLSERGGRLIETGREKYGRKLGQLIIGWPSTGEAAWADLAISEGHVVAWNGKGKRHDWCG